jgi:hypothetical protein
MLCDSSLKKTKTRGGGGGGVWFINNINLKYATKSYNILLNMQWKVIMVIVCEEKLWFFTIVNFLLLFKKKKRIHCLWYKR